MADYKNIPGSDIYIAYSKNLGISGVFAGMYKGQDVAVKRITAAQSNEREIEVMAQLPQHLHTVRYITSHKANEGTDWFIVMELCKRANLSHIIEMNKDLHLDTKITIVLHLLQGLKHLHDNNVAHRDLKPHNVLLSMDEKSIKICDFGLSKPVDSSSGAWIKSRTSIGTEGWWSPESKKGREASAKTDIYSAGLISFHVLSNGGHAFGDKNSYEKALVNDSLLVPVWTALERSLQKSAAFFLSRHLIKAMLQKVPEDRPKVAKVLAHPLFWAETTKVDFLYHLKDMFRSSASFKSCIEVPDWVEQMHLSDTECRQHEYDGKRLGALFTMAKDLSSSKPKKAPATLFVKLVRKCVSDLRKNSESGQSFFKSGKQLWTFFLTKFSSEILQIYDHLNELPEATTEAFASFKALPGRRDLNPGDIIIPSHEETEGPIQLSDTYWMFPDKILSEKGKIFEGEIRSGISGCVPVIVKLAVHNIQSITEAKILTKLNYHSSILPIMHTDIYRGGSTEKIYMVLEKCHSENLYEFITNRKNPCGPFDLIGAFKVVQQIIDGMIHIHDNKIIHKDISPHSILLSADQKTIRIAGFGSSVEIGSVSAEIFEEAERENNTPGYSPPEFYENKVLISQKSDIFSLGATFYFVLTNGENPFGDDPDIWVHNIKKGIISLKHSHISNMETTENYIRHMIDPKPNNRPTIWQVSEHPCWTELDRASAKTSSPSAASTTAIKDSVE